jgi:hypothetical protein
LVYSIHREAIEVAGLYYALMMSTGLTFGTISSLFRLNHGVIDQAQYSHLVATVIGSVVIPTMIANALFLPRHLLPAPEPKSQVPVSMTTMAGVKGYQSTGCFDDGYNSLRGV